jgi:hypothetical protein
MVHVDLYALSYDMIGYTHTIFGFHNTYYKCIIFALYSMQSLKSNIISMQKNYIFLDILFSLYFSIGRAFAMLTREILPSYESSLIGGPKRVFCRVEYGDSDLWIKMENSQRSFSWAMGLITCIRWQPLLQIYGPLFN